MTDKERLNFLLSYHHNLSLQFTAVHSDIERRKLGNALGKLEEEIEALLFVA
ncbi:hypothetical protein [Cytobacillus horneckiae]|uniref:hypothetical protein n=1 Tax=Cytobacillus horneckiae TaxID=549687 RepID=UPI003D23171D